MRAPTEESSVLNMSLKMKAAIGAVIGSRELTVEELTRVGGGLSEYDDYDDYGGGGGGGGGYYDSYGGYDYGGGGGYDYGGYSGYTDYSDYAGYDPAGYESTADYCSYVPDAPFGYEFGSACYNHDVNYSADTTMTRYEADQQFLSDMKEICAEQYNNDTACLAAAYIYYEGVRFLGGFFYKGPVDTAWDNPSYNNP